MAKSKYVKKQEAIERARAYLPTARARWFDYQQGGKVYEGTAKHNKEYAEQLRIDANEIFAAAAERAHTDLHGNPL